MDGHDLVGAASVAVSPDGYYVYVASFDSSAVATFARHPTTGVLGQLNGVAGCVAEIGDGVTCSQGRGLGGAVSVAVSPDGRHLYVASRGNAVAVFARNARAGELAQLDGAAGCIAEAGDGMTCTGGTALVGPRMVTVSPDGKSVYIGSRDSDAVAVFARNLTTGALAQLNGPAGCIAEYGDGVACTVGTGLREAVFLTVSPDGANLYIASQLSDAVAAFSRNAMTGGLTQLPGVAGCVSDDGSDDGTPMRCAHGNGLLGAIAVTVSPDGRTVYAASYLSSAVSVFNRE
jgi:DNA-binding beta-propeller fold protein YncE